MNCLLSIVATPIGNPGDLSPRALDTLRRAEVIFIEEYRVGKKMLDRLGIDTSEKKLIELNEHTEKDFSEEECAELFLAHRQLALVSDAGTPLVADPGGRLTTLARELGCKTTFIPGACSPLAALVLSGFPAHRFHYAGFVSPKRPERRRDLTALRELRCTVIIMETPYRLLQLLEEVK